LFKIFTCRALYELTPSEISRFVSSATPVIARTSRDSQKSATETSHLLNCIGSDLLRNLVQAATPVTARNSWDSQKSATEAQAEILKISSRVISHRKLSSERSFEKITLRSTAPATVGPCKKKCHTSQLCTHGCSRAIFFENDYFWEFHLLPKSQHPPNSTRSIFPPSWANRDRRCSATDRYVCLPTIHKRIQSDFTECM